VTGLAGIDDVTVEVVDQLKSAARADALVSRETVTL
jgi:hypothetical protein